MFLNNRIIILAALTALAPFAIDTYLPAFHQIEIDLNSTSEFVQQTLTFYLIPYTLMTLFHGAISDSIGRLKTIFIGLTLFKGSEIPYTTFSSSGSNVPNILSQIINKLP